MFKRNIEQEIIDMSQSYPVVTVTGPRQSGKTTLVKKIFSSKAYVSLENLDSLDFVKSDPRRFLSQYPDGVILDEVQRCPEILSYIQGVVDEKEIKGMFILTGSYQLSLHQSITQSLAGRTAILRLLPFSLSELANSKISLTIDEALFNGMYPRIYNDGLNPTKFYDAYTKTYIEGDLRQLINVKDLNIFYSFLKICASRVGQVFKSKSVSNELGVSYHTVNNWLSILESSYLVVRLQPYFENFGKRIIKSPKLYFTDVGLASYLLDIREITQVARDPLRGNLYENLVVIELMKSQYNIGYEPSFYFYRDSNGNEIDIIYKNANQLVPIEIKSSQTFNSNFLRNLKYFKGLVNDRCNKGYLIYAGEIEQQIDDFEIINHNNISSIFKPVEN